MPVLIWDGDTISATFSEIIQNTLQGCDNFNLLVISASITPLKRRNHFEYNNGVDSEILFYFHLIKSIKLTLKLTKVTTCFVIFK